MQCADKSEGITINSQQSRVATRHQLRSRESSALSGIKVSSDLNVLPRQTARDTKIIWSHGPRSFCDQANDEARNARRCHHMSEKGVNEALTDAEQIPGSYRLVSGHTNIRPAQGNENSPAHPTSSNGSVNWAGCLV